MSPAAHPRNLVVWDIPEALGRGARFRLKLGLKCGSACPASGWELAVLDHTGRPLRRLPLGQDLCPGTEALHFVEFELDAPAEEGEFAWTAIAPASAACDDASAAHEAVRASFSLRVVDAADTRLRVLAFDRERQQPIEAARVVVHPFRALTDAGGQAELLLPRGPYRLFVSGRSFLPFRRDGELAEDTTLRVELEPDIGPGDAELWS